MNSSDVCLINLGQGALGSEVADLLGGFLINGLQLAAESRHSIWPPEARVPFWIYCDELQNLVDESFEKFLNEARGFGVSLVTANQNLSQLPPKLRLAMLGNARIKVAFRVSADDAEILAPEFFRISSERVKERHLAFANIGFPIPYFEDKYFSVSEEARQNREALHYLDDRLMWVHVAGQSAPRLLRTVDIPQREVRGAGNRIDRFLKVIYDVQRSQNSPNRLRAAKETLESTVAEEPESAKPLRFGWVGRPPNLS